MTIGQILLGVAMFAAATAVLYVWGMKKALDQGEDMTRNLLSACGSRVVKHLKKHGRITKAQVAGVITGVRVRQFWSRKSLTVQNGAEFAPQVIDFLLDQQYIQKDGPDGFVLRP
ncbi:MAG: hypothetical protein IJ484_02860 [Oscillospiraceae bacterium]|nr:hypothetical protein [Oscillospiraceae bacterium]